MKFVYPMRPDGLFCLKNDDYEDMARETLEKHDPDVLSEASILDIEKLAENLDLVIDEEYLSEDGTILGAISFGDTIETYFDYKFQPKKVELGQGQILIDPRLRTRYNYGRRRFTIAHEIGHWLTQRTYHSPTNQIFEYRKSVVECRSENIERYSYEEVNWVERQADRMASALLMPKEIFKSTAQTIIDHSGLMTNYLIEGQSIERSSEIIEYISEIFGVSKTAATIRMKHLGLIKKREEYKKKI